MLELVVVCPGWKQNRMFDLVIILPLQNHLLHPTASLEWTQYANLPNGRRHAQAVMHNGKTYIGGGYSDKDEIDHHVYAYDPHTNMWDTLPDSPTRWFSVVVFDGNLVLVGGKEKSGGATNKVVSFDEKEQRWVQDRITPMPTARMGSSAVAHASYLIVAGGWDDTRFRLNTVEIFDREKNCWFVAAPLPQKAAEMKQALGNGTWFLLGGSNQSRSVFYVSLQSLVANAMQTSTDHSSPQHPDSIWKSLPDVPYVFSSAALSGNSLLALGGQSSLGWMIAAIYAYMPHTHSWLRIADMPLRVSRACAMTIPSSGELLLVGGKTRDNATLSTIHKCTIRIK